MILTTMALSTTYISFYAGFSQADTGDKTCVWPHSTQVGGRSARRRGFGQLYMLQRVARFLQLYRRHRQYSATNSPMRWVSPTFTRYNIPISILPACGR